MEQMRIEEENRRFFVRKERLSDFESWALKEFVFRFYMSLTPSQVSQGAGREWWWADCKLYVGSGRSFWLTDNGNVMYEVVNDEEDELYLIRF